MSACTLVLIRHAATDWNESGRLQGQTDIPLNERGRIQAAALADWFRQNDVPVVSVHSSDLQRASETAKAVADVFGLEVRQDPRFRERDLGSAEGKTWNEMATSGGSIDPGTWSIDSLPGVEPRLSVVCRLNEGLLDAAQHGAEKAIVVVSHGSALSSWLQWRFRLPQRPRLKNTAVVTVTDYPGRGRLRLP